ncbi:hypothetical protein CFOL_v3_27164 [Cephalotus follicularis]|uniref:Uncharacterized protein n=1 Tax=Cephalotus follicularis TaxID=3775 RepID=A0A1Q3CUI9_CEPFO|nr:hypothetical protein CFOL_v3_27164 [Cephalotus follicularis]
MAARKQKTSWSGHQEEKGKHSRNAPGKKQKRKERSELHRDDLRHKLSRREESPPLRSPAETRDTEKYCRYHRDHGHDTEECRQLKNQIEDLIRKGQLRKYVDTDAPQVRRERREEAPQQPAEQQQQQLRSVIHTISGGVASGGDHKNTRKAYGRKFLAV